MPPRHAKSTTCSHYFPAWYLGWHPEHRVILTTYNASFAATWGRKVRDTIGEFGGPLFGLKVRGDSSAADEWNLVGREGGMVTAGVGGGITGRGADVLIMDDTVKDAEEALSSTTRQKQKDWYDSTADTRLEPGAIELLIMTRWHWDDLGGHVLQRWRESGEPFLELKLPALAKENDPLGRAVGEALWPVRYPAEFFHRKRRSSPFWYSALYDQEPTPEGGAIFRAEWFTRYRLFHDTDGRPEGVRVLATGECVRFHQCVVFAMVDPAIGKKRTGDDVAIGVFAITPGGALVVVHVLARVMPVESIVPTLRDVCRAWPWVQFVGIEANGFQVTIAQSARATAGIPLVREIDPGTTSKMARAVPAVELASGGRVWVPDGAGCEWVGPYLTELCQWTAQDGDKDNRVDVTAYAAKELVERYGQDDDEPMVLGQRHR